MGELEAAIAPLLWSGVAVGAALAVLAAFVLRRGTTAVAPAREPVPARDWWLLGALTLLGAALRLTEITAPLGTDEAATFLYYASRPLAIGLTIYGSPNNHLLHTALAHAAVRLFGDAEWALRLPAFLAGVALVPLTWMTARRVRSGAPLVAAALVAGAPTLVDYSMQARGYTMLCAFTLVAAAAIADVAASGARRAAIVFAVAAALGFYTVPVMLYPFVFLGVWAMLTARRRAPVAAALAAALLLTLALYAPVLIVSGLSALAANAYVRPLPFTAFLHVLPRAPLLAWSRMMSGIPLVVQLLLAAGAVASRRVTIAVVAGLLAVALVVVAQRVVPFERVWLPFLPLLCIGAAYRLRFEGVVAILAAIALGTASLATERPRDVGALPNVTALARTLRARLRAGDAVLAATPSDLPLAFYLRGAPADVLHPDAARARRLFVVSHRAGGRTLPGTVAAFHLDPRAYRVRRVDDRGGAAVYELTAR